MDFIQPTANRTIGINDVSSLKLLTRLRVRFSHLREDKFKHNFQNTLNLLHLVPLKQKTAITFFCGATIFLINEMSFSMTLLQLNQKF